MSKCVRHASTGRFDYVLCYGVSFGGRQFTVPINVWLLRSGSLEGDSLGRDSGRMWSAELFPVRQTGASSKKPGATSHVRAHVGRSQSVSHPCLLRFFYRPIWGSESVTRVTSLS